ncbi:MAG: hypothetical protein QOH21_3220 [Acidobacteriota bacterium]|jgi:hypothetical protein|nr:hypothetical protein [Acidobacteriota bacterium]
MTVATVPSPVGFINMPYVRRYEPVYLAFIAGLAGFGISPSAAVHDPSSQFQLDRTFQLVSNSDYSFHDLSLLSLDRTPPPTPHFNMPFELGLAVATARLKNRNHQWFVFGSDALRLNKALSDLGGVNIRVHDMTPESILRSLLNALDREAPKPSYADLHAIYISVQKAARSIKRELGGSLFDTRPFGDLSYVAIETARALQAATTG